MDKTKIESKFKAWEGVNKYLAKKYRLLKPSDSAPLDEPEVVEEEVKVKATSEELWGLKKKEQIELLEVLGAIDIPRKEADRVKLILALQ